MKYLILVPITALILNGCSSTPAKNARVFIDSSNHSDDLPQWAAQNKVAWEKDNQIYFKSRYTVRGDETINGCEELAKLDTKQALLSEISNEIKGAIDNAQQSISENAENILGKVRSEKFEGTISGLRFSDTYFERFKTGETERINCFVLGSIGRSDYEKIKNSMVNRLVQIAPELKAAITKKQVRFFSDKGVQSNSKEIE